MENSIRKGSFSIKILKNKKRKEEETGSNISKGSGQTVRGLKLSDSKGHRQRGRQRLRTDLERKDRRPGRTGCGQYPETSDGRQFSENKDRTSGKEQQK